MAHSKGQAHSHGHSHGDHGHGGQHTGSDIHHDGGHGRHMSDHMQNPHNKMHAGHTDAMHDHGGMFPMGAGGE